MPFRRLYLLCLFMCKLSPEVAAEVQESSDGPGAREPVWLTDVQAAMEFVAAAEVTVIGFFQVRPDTPPAVVPPKNQKYSTSREPR